MSLEMSVNERLANRFLHHAPTGTQASRYEEVRRLHLELAKRCVEITPCSPEQTRAIDALDESMMLFNAAIARNE